MLSKERPRERTDLLAPGTRMLKPPELGESKFLLLLSEGRVFCDGPD